MTFKNLYNYIIDNNGITCQYGKIADFSAGYIVSNKHGLKLKNRKISIILYNTLIKIFKKSDKIIGLWVDSETGIIYIDFNKIFIDKAKAIDYGLLNKQIAIYNITDSIEIRLNDKQENTNN